MIKLIKDESGKWIKPTNNFNSKEFEENNKPISIETPSVVYLPVHNINDIYEWFRIFKNAHIVGNNISHHDKYGFGIHAYFDKSRGESIKGWFPNLYEVKASTSDVVIYTSIYPNYYKHSKDFIEFLYDKHEQLFIDNVEIFNDELVLIKNQENHILNFYPTDLTLTDQANTYYALITPGDEKYFSSGSTAIVKTSLGFVEDTIINVSYDTLGFNNYVVITLKNEHLDIIEIADKYNGNYTLIDYREYNGIYKYKNKFLTPILDMYDNYKVYNQIVYTYQGETNSNKEFYLRRIEDKNDTNYSHFPSLNSLLPMIYSQGDAYLVKCQLNYNLSIDASVTQIINANCCGCSTQQTNIAHPIGSGPYTEDEDPFRLMYLDYDQANKVFATSDLGGAKYVLDNAQLGDLSFIEFSETDINGNPNFLQKYTSQYFIADSPVGFSPAYFEYYQNSATETTNLTFNNNSNNINVSTDIIQNTDTTTFNINYDGSQKILPTGLYFSPGAMVELDFIFVIDNNAYNALTEVFQIVSVTKTLTNISLEVYPKLDTNFYNELILAGELGANDFNLNMDFLNFYGSESGNLKLNAIDLYKKLNKTILGKVYNFNFVVDEVNGTAKLALNGIRQDTEYIYQNLGTSVNTPIDTYFLKHEISSDYTIYNQQYTLNKYLTSYLNVGVVNTSATTIPFQLLVDDTNPSSYLYVGGATTKFGLQGNIIYFGKWNKEIIFDNLAKDTILNLTDLIDIFDVWIENIEYDETTEIGKITLLEFIPVFASGTNLYFSGVQSSTDISGDLYAINNIEIAHELDSTQYLPYKVDTAGYAYRLMQHNDNDKLISNVTGVLFKENNSPRITFLKRDRFFDFEEDLRIDVATSSALNIDIITTPANIGGSVLVLNDLVVLTTQTLAEENGVYVFNGAGNPLTRYTNFGLNIYYRVLGGININKCYIAKYDLPLVYGTTQIVMVEKSYRRKSDPRLTLKPISIYKLGVDNKTQPERKINKKYDVLEASEDLVIIQPGINSINQIRFIDGLSEYNILNNINGQGQYAWILNDDTIVENAIVGCTQDNGPGTGTLIWYTGTWVTGTWCYGIWMQGLWKDGIWMDGIWNAFGIQDNNTFVIVNNLNNNLLSKWENGTWVTGTFNAGIIDYIAWLDGTFNNGIINDGNWTTGKFYNGIIKHIIWEGGIMYGGDFETGIWKDGLLSQLDPTIPARFGINSTSSTLLYSSHAIWKKGMFNGGEFHSGNNNTEHNSSIFYSGEFKNGNWYGGTFVSGIFNTGIWWDGIWFGGYKCSITDIINDDKLITFTPSYYDSIMGLTSTVGYIQHIENSLHLYNQAFYLLATPNIADTFSQNAFINIWDLYNSSTYTTKSYIANTATDGITATLSLNIINSPATTSYVAADILNSIPDGEPFICAEFTGTWKGGIWFNGLFKAGNFENGLFANGYAIDVVFG